jgi:hypothetical protein
MTRLSINLPFPGFYESELTQATDCAESILACQLEEDGPDWSAEWLNENLWYCVDYRAAHAAIAVQYTAELAEAMSEDQPRKIALEFECLDSPREYNFTTDRLFAFIALDDLTYMQATTKPETFAATLLDRFTSRSGFISFYSANAATWNEKPLETWDANEAGTLLLAWLADHVPDYHATVHDALGDDDFFYTTIDDALDRDALLARFTNKET